MPERRRPKRAILVAGTICLLAAGCQPADPAAVQSPGPFGEPFVHLGSCSPARIIDKWFGSGTLTNGGDRPVTIDQVLLEKAKGMKLMHAVLIPDVTPPGRFFSSSRHPPKSYSRTELKNWRWEDRIPAVGATLPPGRSYELLVLARRTAAKGYFDGIRVDYHDDQAHYTRTEDDRRAAMGIRPRDCGIELP